MFNPNWFLLIFFIKVLIAAIGLIQGAPIDLVTPPINATASSAVITEFSQKLNANKNEEIEIEEDLIAINEDFENEQTTILPPRNVSLNAVELQKEVTTISEGPSITERNEKPTFDQIPVEVFRVEGREISNSQLNSENSENIQKDVTATTGYQYPAVPTTDQIPVVVVRVEEDISNSRVNPEISQESQKAAGNVSPTETTTDQIPVEVVKVEGFEIANPQRKPKNLQFTQEEATGGPYTTESNEAKTTDQIPVEIVRVEGNSITNFHINSETSQNAQKEANENSVEVVKVEGVEISNRQTKPENLPNTQNEGTTTKGSLTTEEKNEDTTVDKTPVEVVRVEGIEISNTHINPENLQESPKEISTTATGNSATEEATTHTIQVELVKDKNVHFSNTHNNSENFHYNTHSNTEENQQFPTETTTVSSPTTPKFEIEFTNSPSKNENTQNAIIQNLSEILQTVEEPSKKIMEIESATIARQPKISAIFYTQSDTENTQISPEIQKAIEESLLTSSTEKSDSDTFNSQNKNDKTSEPILFHNEKQSENSFSFSTTEPPISVTENYPIINENIQNTSEENIPQIQHNLTHGLNEQHTSEYLNSHSKTVNSQNSLELNLTQNSKIEPENISPITLESVNDSVEMKASEIYNSQIITENPQNTQINFNSEKSFVSERNLPQIEILKNPDEIENSQILNKNLQNVQITINQQESAENFTTDIPQTIINQQIENSQITTENPQNIQINFSDEKSVASEGNLAQTEIQNQKISNPNEIGNSPILNENVQNTQVNTKHQETAENFTSNFQQTTNQQISSSEILTENPQTTQINFNNENSDIIERNLPQNEILANPVEIGNSLNLNENLQININQQESEENISIPQTITNQQISSTEIITENPQNTQINFNNEKSSVNEGSLPQSEILANSVEIGNSQNLNENLQNTQVNTKQQQSVENFTTNTPQTANEQIPISKIITENSQNTRLNFTTEKSVVSERNLAQTEILPNPDELGNSQILNENLQNVQITINQQEIKENFTTDIPQTITNQQTENSQNTTENPQNIQINFNNEKGVVSNANEIENSEILNENLQNPHININQQEIKENFTTNMPQTTNQQIENSQIITENTQINFNNESEGKSLQTDISANSDVIENSQIVNENDQVNLYQQKSSENFTTNIPLTTNQEIESSPNNPVINNESPQLTPIDMLIQKGNEFKANIAEILNEVKEYQNNHTESTTQNPQNTIEEILNVNNFNGKDTIQNEMADAIKEINDSGIHNENTQNTNETKSLSEEISIVTNVSNNENLATENNSTHQSDLPENSNETNRQTNGGDLISAYIFENSQNSHLNSFVDELNQSVEVSSEEAKERELGVNTNFPRENFLNSGLDFIPQTYFQFTEQNKTPENSDNFNTQLFNENLQNSEIVAMISKLDLNETENKDQTEDRKSEISPEISNNSEILIAAENRDISQANVIDLNSQKPADSSIVVNSHNFNSQVSTENPPNAGVYILMEKSELENSTDISFEQKTEPPVENNMNSQNVNENTQNVEKSYESKENDPRVETIKTESETSGSSATTAKFENSDIEGMENSANNDSLTRPKPQNSEIEAEVNSVNNNSETSETNARTPKFENSEMEAVVNTVNNNSETIQTSVTTPKPENSELEAVVNSADNDSLESQSSATTPKSENGEIEAVVNSVTNDSQISLENTGFINSTENNASKKETVEITKTETQNQMETTAIPSISNGNDLKYMADIQVTTQQNKDSLFYDPNSSEEVEDVTQSPGILTSQGVYTHIATAEETESSTSPIPNQEVTTSQTSTEIQENFESVNESLQSNPEIPITTSTQSMEATTPVTNTEVGSGLETTDTTTNDRHPKATTHRQFASLLEETEMNVHKAFETLREWIAKGNKLEESTNNPATQEETTTAISTDDEKILVSSEYTTTEKSENTTTMKEDILSSTSVSNEQENSSAIVNEQENSSSTPATAILTTTASAAFQSQENISQVTEINEMSHAEITTNIQEKEEISTTEEAKETTEGQQRTETTTVEDSTSNTTIEPQLATVHLKENLSGASLTSTDEIEIGNGKANDSSNTTEKSEISVETSTNSSQEIDSNLEVSTEITNMVKFVEHQPTTQKQEITQNHLQQTQASFMEEKQQQLESTTESLLSSQSISNGEEKTMSANTDETTEIVSTTTTLEPASTTTEKPTEALPTTTEASSTTIETFTTTTEPLPTTIVVPLTTTSAEDLTTTTEEPEMATTTLVVAVEPEARSLPLPPPKLEYLQNEDGVEVFYGYSIVKHN